MACRTSQKRLAKEYNAMQKDPPPFIWAVPDERNILIWYYIVRGPPNSPFADGEYYGLLVFPSEYPFKPPGIKACDMLTPSGRFSPGHKICFSMSDFHPKTWNPAWTVATILTGLLSFMLSEEMTIGSVRSSDPDKRIFATQSHKWNLRQLGFRSAFPDYCTQNPRDLPNMGRQSDVHPKSSDRESLSSYANTSSGLYKSAYVHANENSISGSAQSSEKSESNSSARGKWRWILLFVVVVILSKL